MNPDPRDLEEARELNAAEWLRLGRRLCLLATLVAVGVVALRWHASLVPELASPSLERLPTERGPWTPGTALALALPATLALVFWFAFRTRLSAIVVLRRQRGAEVPDEPRVLQVPLSRGRVWRSVLGLLLLVPALVGDALLLQLALSSGLRETDAALELLAVLLGPCTLVGLLIVFYRSGVVLRGDRGWLYCWRGLGFPWIGRWVPFSDIEGVHATSGGRRTTRGSWSESWVELRLRSQPESPLRLKMAGLLEARDQVGRIDSFLKTPR